MINFEVLDWCLEELASREEQERLWLGRSKNEMSSFEEVRCGIFDDSGLTRAIESGYLRKNFSEMLCQKVNDLHDILKLLPDNVRPEVVIEHPKMLEVRVLAHELRELFLRENSSEI